MLISKKDKYYIAICLHNLIEYGKRTNDSIKMLKEINSAQTKLISILLSRVEKLEEIIYDKSN